MSPNPPNHPLNLADPGPERCAPPCAVKGPGSALSTVNMTVWGKPIAKKRPKFARRPGKGGKTYIASINTQETEEGRLLHDLKEQWLWKPLDCPVMLALRFGMPIPKSTSKKARAAMLAGEIHHTKKPDLDNLVKFIKDVCNELVYVDDSRVVQIFANKFYAEDPHGRVRCRQGRSMMANPNMLWPPELTGPQDIVIPPKAGTRAAAGLGSSAGHRDLG